MKTFFRALAPVLGAGLALLSAGCFHTARHHDRVERELAKHSQALTTAVADALESQPETHRDAHSELALQLAREDQRIEGLPPNPIPVASLITNDPAAEDDLAARLRRIRAGLEQRERLEARLIQDGSTWQAEQRARAMRWTKWIGGGSIALGAIVALCVFFPVCIPIVGRILAWIVGKLPSLASALGVVSVNAFDAVVRGIERSRRAQPGAERLHNDRAAASFASPPAAEVLETHLAREMDAAHKALVRERKAALNL